SKRHFSLSYPRIWGTTWNTKLRFSERSYVICFFGRTLQRLPNVSRARSWRGTCKRYLLRATGLQGSCGMDAIFRKGLKPGTILTTVGSSEQAFTSSHFYTNRYRL